jgi:hypothetical protein
MFFCLSFCEAHTKPGFAMSDDDFDAPPEHDHHHHEHRNRPGNWKVERNKSDKLNTVEKGEEKEKKQKKLFFVF